MKIFRQKARLFCVLCYAPQEGRQWTVRSRLSWTVNFRESPTRRVAARGLIHIGPLLHYVTQIIYVQHTKNASFSDTSQPLMNR